MSITPYEPAQPTNDLMIWAEEAAQVHQVAKALASTQFVPPAMKGRPDEVAAQILYGREVGMSPMVALSHINVIEGRPSMSALAMRGLAQTKGVRFRLEESTETRCKMSAIAPGDSVWTTITWTIDRAKKLELTNKKNWLRQPQAMLIARATSELCRLVAAPLFLGLAYSTEEIRDGAGEVFDYAATAEPEPAPEPAPRTIRRKPLKTEATVGDEKKPEPAPEPAPDVQTVSDGVRKALMARFNEAKITDRVTRLAYVSDVLGREVGSVNDITDAEGKSILHQLDEDREILAAEENVQSGWPETVEVPA